MPHKSLFYLGGHMKKLWANRWFRTLAGFLLVAALLAPVLLPAAQLQRQGPENPIREENIQPVNVLSFGETDGGTRASAPLPEPVCSWYLNIHKPYSLPAPAIPRVHSQPYYWKRLHQFL